MISIPIDFWGNNIVANKPAAPDSISKNIAKDSSNSANITHLSLPTWAASLICFLILSLGSTVIYFVKYVRDELSEKITTVSGEITKVHTSLGESTKTLQDHRVSIAQIEKGLSSIEQRIVNLDRPRYESKAKAAGFKNPQIVATRFTGNETVEPKTVLEKGKDFVQYPILKYDRTTNELSVRFDARIGTVQFDNNVLGVKVAPGEVQEVSILRGKGLPRIFVQVLDLPSPDSAVLAIGPKTDPADKTS